MTSASTEDNKRQIFLRRSLAFIDLETTGLNPLLDRIVEIGVLKILPDGTKQQFHSKINPEMRIPAEASLVHGITNKTVEGKPTFKAVASQLGRLLSGCDLAGFNLSSFDLLVLQEEFVRVGVKFSLANRHVVDVQRIYHLKEPRDLATAYRFYCGAEHSHAHSAFEDARVCWEILEGQLKKYQDLPNTPDKLAEFCQQGRRSRFMDSGNWFEARDGKPHFARGKHRGHALKEIADLEPDYLEWILQTQIPKDTALIVTRALRNSEKDGGPRADRGG